MSNYAIGDIQGCFNELIALLEVIHFNPKQDKLWLTGDLINRGPESLATLRFIKKLSEQKQAITVLGNHDLHLLAKFYGHAPAKKQDTLHDILAAPDCLELCDWLRQQPLLYHDSGLGYTMVHAGLPPQWDLPTSLQRAQEVEAVLRGKKAQEFFAEMYGEKPLQWQDSLTGWPRLRIITNYFTRMRFCDTTGTLELKTKGKPDSPPPGFLPWYKVPSRAHKGLKIIFGHWAGLNGHTGEPNIFALDTGCAWGKCLTAMRLEDTKRFSVPCSQVL